MKSIVFICPYFGKLPICQMKLWLQSCEKNSLIKWIIITDDHTTDLCYPKNVEVVYTTLSDLKEYAQKLFQFDISLDTPYKLCDFKPAYGYIFHDYIKDYDYWGHCDMSDCIFGDLSKFLTDEVLDNNDKIGFLGHLTIYRNTDKINKRIFLDTKGKKDNLKYILGSKDNHAFDEINSTSINTIYIENNWPIKRVDEIYRDNHPIYKAFVRTTYDEKFQFNTEYSTKRIYEWINGRLYDCFLSKDGKRVLKQEIGYVHFQKRKMISHIALENHYYIVPNEFILANEELSPYLVKKYSKNKFFYKPYFLLRYKNLKYYIHHLFK